MIQFVVGSYASKTEPALQMIQFDALSQDIQVIATVSGIEHPSFVAVDPSRDLVFAVSEQAQGAVVSYRYHRASRTFQELSRQRTQGADPCYIQLHKSGRWLLGTNYSGGSVFVHPVSDDGTIGPLSQLIRHEGRSVREDRQTAAHPHSIWNLPETAYFIVPDLGTDMLYTYTFDTIVGNLTAANHLASTPGAGPRHIAFHPTKNVLYVINELSSTVDVCSFDVETGRLNRLQEDVACLPGNVDRATSTAADIHVSTDGCYVYVSNRGHDSIAVLLLNDHGLIDAASSGRVTTVSTQGKTPRNFVIVNSEDQRDYVFAANQDSDSVVVFTSEQGRFTRLKTALSTLKPVCVVHWS